MANEKHIAQELARTSFALGITYARESAPSGYFDILHVIAEYKTACKNAGISLYTFISRENFDYLVGLGMAEETRRKNAALQLAGK